MTLNSIPSMSSLADKGEPLNDAEFRQRGHSRISHCFQGLKDRNEKALIAYVTVGDPDLETTRRLALTLANAGADIIELGIPFSDPLLDGPVIQAASQRALDRGARVSHVFDLAASIRKETQVPLVLMTCLNPIHRLGYETFAQRAAEAGVDGILVTDLPPEEGQEWIATAQSHGLDCIFMLAPTSSPERIRAVSEKASGFIYCQSRAGVTGEQQSAPPDLDALVARVRVSSSLPIGVGFGISTPEHVRAVTGMAEGAVVGTAFVRLIGEGSDDIETVAGRVSHLAAQLKAATRHAG